MRARRIAAAAVGGAICLSGGIAIGQSVAKPAISMSVAQAEPGTEVISSPDLGFRVERYDRDGAPVGELVVRKDGKWVPVEFGARMKAVK